MYRNPFFRCFGRPRVHAKQVSEAFQIRNPPERGRYSDFPIFCHTRKRGIETFLHAKMATIPPEGVYRNPAIYGSEMDAPSLLAAVWLPSLPREHCNMTRAGNLAGFPQEPTFLYIAVDDLLITYFIFMLLNLVTCINLTAIKAEF